MYEIDYEDKEERNNFHFQIISQMWFKVAAEIYRQYKKQGRGVLALFMMDDFPSCLAEMLPVGKEPTGKGAIGTYIPRDKLLPLEDLVGERGLLSIDKQLGEYDPETTIVFAFIQKVRNEEGKAGIFSTGYSVKPPAWCSPRTLFETNPEVDTSMLEPRSEQDNPQVNLN